MFLRISWSLGKKFHLQKYLLLQIYVIEIADDL